MAKYTSGPWISEPGATHGMIVTAPNEPKVRRNVAACGGSNRVANAALIAAAPDLLAALETAVSTGMLEHGGMAGMCRAAIARAKGE